MSYRPRYKAHFIALSRLSLFLMSTAAGFGIVVVLMTKNEHVLQGHSSFKYFMLADIITTLASIYVARYIYRTRIEMIEVETYSTRDRLEQLKTIIFLHHATCNIPCILNMICYILFGNFVFLILFVVVFVEMVRKYPTEDRVNDAVNILPLKFKK